FSPAAGFLWGWAMFWSMHSGIIAAIAMVFGRYAATIMPLSDIGIRLVAGGARRRRAARLPARAGRRPVRLRRLAHGDLRGGGDARSGADDSAGLDAR